MLFENDYLSDRGHLTLFDYSVFILLIVVSVFIGILVGLRGWRKATTKDFLVGGRKMHPIPVSMSLIGGVISALSVLGNATEMYLHGTQLWLNIVGCLWGTLVVMFLILPTLYPLELISMMQYLEIRFDSVLLKKLGSISQLVSMSFFLGVCLYAPSLTLSSVTNLPTWASITTLGLVCTLYISIGGVKAVVYTDVVQTSIMFIGIIAVIAVVCLDLGGVGVVFQIAEEGGRLQLFNFDPSPFVRHSFWSVQILGLYFVTSVVGISQPQFQRLSSVRTLKQSQGICVIFYVGLVILWSLFYFTGLVAYAAYVDCDPLANKQIEKADQIIPFLVADKLERFPGMAGLFVAAVYGAVLSSVSSQASAFAALFWEDFMANWQWFRKTVPISPTNVTRLLTAFAGCLGVGLAFLVGGLGTLFQAAYSVTGAFIGPLDGLFVTAIAAPWVNEKGAVCGFLTSLLFNMWLICGKLFYGAGKAEPLPLSTKGCKQLMPNGTNSIMDEFFNISTTSQPSLTTLQGNIDMLVDGQPVKERDYLEIYDVSYCYLGTIGILVVFTVSSVVSILTGPNNPYEVDEKLVNIASLRAYRWIWSRFNRKKTLAIATSKENGILDSSSTIDITNRSFEMEQINKHK